MNSERWFHVFVVCWLIVVAGIARWTGLENYALSPDDVLILGIAQSETLGELFENASREVHPPMFYLVLRMVALFGSDEVFLRAVMMALGLLSIPVVYFAGVRFIPSKVGAVAMGLAAALSPGALLETTTLRHYSLVVLLSSVGWFLFLWYRESRKSSVLYGYGALVLLGILTHYSQLILFGAIGVAHLIVLLSAKDTRKYAIRFCAVNVPGALVGLYFVWAHVTKQWMGSGHYDYIVNHAYRLIFPTDAEMWLNNTVDLGTWLSMAHVPGNVAGVLAILGLVILRFGRGRGLLAVILCVIGFQVIGTTTKAYPFGSTRHCLYLLPIFAFALGVGVGAPIDWALRKVKKSQRSARSMITRVILLVGVSVPMTYTYVRDRSYRDSVPAHASYPVLSSDFAQLMSKLNEQVRPGMSIVTNRQSSMYLRYETKNISGMQVVDVLYKIPYRGADFYYLDDKSVAHDPPTLGALIEAVVHHGKIRPSQPVYLFTVGWNMSTIESLSQSSQLAPGEVLVANSSGVLLRLPLERLRRFFR